MYTPFRFWRFGSIGRRLVIGVLLSQILDGSIWFGERCIDMNGWMDGWIGLLYIYMEYPG